METRTRTIAKAASWQMLGLASMTGLAWLQTGSASGAFTFATGAALTGFVFYFLHERIWASIGWGLSGENRTAGTRSGDAAPQWAPRAGRSCDRGLPARHLRPAESPAATTRAISSAGSGSGGSPVTRARR